MSAIALSGISAVDAILTLIRGTWWRDCHVSHPNNLFLSEVTAEKFDAVIT
jgi:hypothetical protein